MAAVRPLLAIVLAVLVLGTAETPRLHADARQALVAAGTGLTVTTAHSIAVFQKADLVGLTNVLTGESYLTHPSAGELANVDTVAATGEPLAASNWAVAFDGEIGATVAQIILNDSVRTMTMKVWVDAVSDEIVIRTSAEVTNPGVRTLSWSLAGLDLEDGRLIVPADTGRVLDASRPGIGSTLRYPQEWHAQMSVYEAETGSFVLYSTDAWMYSKRLGVATRGSRTVDVAIATEAVGPFGPATAVPQVDWRLKAFAGDWQTAAVVYKDWLNIHRPPVSTAAYPWVADIRTVARIEWPDENMLAPLAAVFVPSQTLIYVPNWRASDYDNNYPDYTPSAGTAAFVSAAQALGFKVMLHVDLPGVSTYNADYATVQAYHVRDPNSLALQGWVIGPENDPRRFAYINPASSAFRALWIARVGTMVSAVQPDALHLDISTLLFNDGNGIIEGRSYAAGSARMHEEFMAAYPNVALGGEGANDVLYRFHAFEQVIVFSGCSADLGGHPLVSYLFAPMSRYYGHLCTPTPDDSTFPSVFRNMVIRGALPTFSAYFPSQVDTSNADRARMVGLAQAWQTHALQLSPGDWLPDVVRWEGAAAATGSVTHDQGLLAVSVNGSVLAQLANGANQVSTPRFSPNWPAFDATKLFGLDPDRFYWLDALARPSTTHVTSLPLGIKVDDGTMVGPQFAHVRLAPVATPTFDAVASLIDGASGVRYLGADLPLANGALANVQSVASGGVSRTALFLHPPWQAQVGGETFIEYGVTVPSAGVLRFAVGIRDGAACTDGVTMRVSTNGSDIWSQHTMPGGWQEVELPLGQHANQAIPLRLTSHPGPANNAGCDWSAWADVRIESAGSSPAIAVPVTIGAGSTYAGYAGGGLAVPISPTSLAISNLPVPSGFTVFTGAGTLVSAGTSLTATPWQAWVQSRTGLATLGSIFGSGTLSNGSAGGVFKNPTMNAHPPNDGLARVTWVVQLPAGQPLRLNWSAGILDGAASPDGIEFSVRVNGHSYWSLTTSANAWVPGSLDLSAWQGQTVLIELATDSRPTNNFDWAHWADLGFSAVGGACVYSVPAGANVGAAGDSATFGVTAATGCPWLAVASEPWLSVTSSPAGHGNGTLEYDVAPNYGGPRSGTITVGGQVFTVQQAAGSSDAVANGAFAGGLAGWQIFATNGSGASDPSFISATIANGVLEFYRVPPPPMTANQATVFQHTGLAVPSGGGVEGSFDLGNSSTVRKRISVLILEADFSDLSVCTFWLAPGAPLRTYRMRTHTTKPWTNAAIYFYAATAGADGGAYLVDNVTLHPNAALPGDRTDCEDPVGPAPSAVADGTELLTNGNFATGTTAGWSLFGALVSQVTNGVFEFYRPTAVPDPAGVILQLTNQPIAPGEILTAEFDLGNSSSVRKRVTVLLHDADFSDLHACTFWLAPGQPLSSYTMRSYATEAWTNATLSIYAASVGNETWMELDNASLRKTPSAAIAGTDCFEPLPALEGDGPVFHSLPPLRDRPRSLADRGLSLIGRNLWKTGPSPSRGRRSFPAAD